MRKEGVERRVVGKGEKDEERGWRGTFAIRYRMLKSAAHDI